MREPGVSSIVAVCCSMSASVSPAPMKGFTMSNVSMQVLFPFSDIEMSKSRYMLGKSSLVGVQFDDGAVAVGLWLDRAVHAADDHSMRRTTAQRSASADRDFAALVLRLAIGPMLIAHGSNKVMGSGGLDGTTGWFESLGLRLRPCTHGWPPPPRSPRARPSPSGLRPAPRGRRDRA